MTGISHVALFVRDIDSSLSFYRDFLGFHESKRLFAPDGTTSLVFLKVSDTQWLELFPERERGSDRLFQIAFRTDDAEALRDTLARLGYRVPGSLWPNRIGNLSFHVADPDSHLIEFVQYRSEGETMRDSGRHIGTARIANHLKHVGLTVRSLDSATAFYVNILGCTEIWRGSSSGMVLDWVNLRLPGDADYVEFMLYSEPPDSARRGVMNHLSFEVADVEAARKFLEAHPKRMSYHHAVVSRIGINKKRQLNLFDPDGTRVELMEPSPIDGIPAPSSPAPPPR